MTNMANKILKIFICAFLFLGLILPLVSNARPCSHNPRLECDAADNVIGPAAGWSIWSGTNCAPDPSKGPTAPCDLCDALHVTQNIITLMTGLAIALATVMLVVGAIILMVAADNESRVAQGKKAITSAFWGLVIALGAWIIVNTILHILTGSIHFPWTEIQC